MNYLLTIFLVWLGSLNNQSTLPINDNDYRAAKYSTVIDYSKLQSISPHLPSQIITYRYYIQYGEDIVIEITDPGDDISKLPVVHVTWDYGKKVLISKFMMDHVHKYYSTTDTIDFSVNDKKGSVRNFCDPTNEVPFCDSLLYSSSPASDYLLYLKDSISNIRSHGLFYPDIEFLPYKIISQGAKRRIRTLDQVIVGKPAIDSLLYFYGHEGYTQISEREMSIIRQQYPPESYQYMLPKD